MAEESHFYDEGCSFENVDATLRGVAAATIVMQAAITSPSLPTQRVLLDFLDLVRHASHHARAELEATVKQTETGS